jgi:hypothetical protein
MMPHVASETRVPCSYSTRDHLRSLKQGDETYDTLFRKMMEQYDPSRAEVVDDQEGSR